VGSGLKVDYRLSGVPNPCVHIRAADRVGHGGGIEGILNPQTICCYIVQCGKGFGGVRGWLWKDYLEIVDVVVLT
jgi:hypothetical protein